VEIKESTGRAGGFKYRMNGLPQLPLAWDETLVKAIIGGIMMVLWAAGHLLSDKGKAKPPARPRPQAPPGQAPGAGAPGKQPASLEETLRREVEEFMRRAQGREPAAPAKRAPTPPPQRGPQRSPQRKQPAKPAVREQPAKAQRPRLADSRQPAPISIEEGRGALTGATISQHVAEHLGGVKAIAAHAQTLGADVAQADERMEAHLQEKFTHRLGALGRQEAPTQVAVSSAATDLLKLLSQPGGAKTMIIANEILRRPEERWKSSTRSLRRGT
jgi:hypothetical protein